ncbi:MAG TPA: reverse transcriptase/maturase family protein [Acetivibrio sp.]|uniref:reverse transcriptase/maturase family protein n=1 Tax=Acetivibrio sp. TaxID=1872092 RepID=UPI002BFD5E86|nr:reverse transcriptase/maturase family protein [Acetivibrio sp.]HOM03855.1 reverse transcriptase/maturase family protein [Acetivibrio sp.]
MPVTYNNLYNKIYSFNNLYSAYLKARKCKRYRKEVLDFTSKLEENLLIIQNELIWKTYEPGRFKEFYVYDPKKRLIHAPAFRDRVIHHALCNIIEPLFEKKFIYDSYACRKGKGTHAAVKRVQKFMRKLPRNSYVLKADISQYFPSINHSILMNIIQRTIRCKDTLWLIETIIFQTDQGLPIGALTSQLFANVYLNELDHFIKDQLGVKYYLRYMDDFVIAHPDKKYLKQLLCDIQDFLITRLALKLNPKTRICPYAQGVDFAGYRTWPTHILPRKRNVKRAKRMFKKLMKDYALGIIDLDYIKPRLMSFLGYMKHCDGYITLHHILSEFVLKR